jgi:hypothetical protein
VQGSSQSARKVVGVVEKVCVYSGVLGLVRARPGFFTVIQRADWGSSFANLSISAFWWMLKVRGAA